MDVRAFIGAYKPLLVIVGMLLLASVASTVAFGHGWRDAMLNFMAGFFLVFSGLKFLDVRGFAAGYASYDLLARRVRAYGFVYPFLELGLGLSYLTRTELSIAHLATVILMTFGGIGVVVRLLRGGTFQCACLGTMIKVPLTAVTIVENFGMALMALLMLLA